MNIKKFLSRHVNETEDEDMIEGSVHKLPLQNMFYGLGFVILFFWILKVFDFIFITITLSVFSCFMLMPIIHTIVKRTKWKLGLVSFCTSIIYALIVIFAVVIVSSNLGYFFSNFTFYEQQLNSIINDVISKFMIFINDIDKDILPGKISVIQSEFSIRDYIMKLISLDFYLVGANSFMSFLSGFFLVFLFISFLLNEAEKTSLKLKKVVDEDTCKSLIKNTRIISKKISGYLIIKTILSFTTALITWIILKSCNLENSITWAFFTFAFNFIPTIGSIAITGLITLMGVIQFYPLWGFPLLIFLLVAATQVIIGVILDPKLQGDQLDLSPVLILISLAFWNYIWGIIGMFLAVPMLEVLRITCNSIQGLQPIAVFISSGKRMQREIHEAQNGR